MRFRFGLVVGFAAGYYLGSKAGRERYEEIQRRLEALRDTRVFEKLQAAVELAVERLQAETQQADVDLTLEPVAPWEGSPTP
jgi:hypothetical protein